MARMAVSFPIDAQDRVRLEKVVGPAVEVAYLQDLPAPQRKQALGAAQVLFARNTGKELDAAEHGMLEHLALIQFFSAGIDYVPLDRLPSRVPIATNGGAFAEPMAEHAVAMMLAGAKRLVVEHANLSRGAFNQFTPTRMLRGLTVGILGFGGIGIATARLCKVLGMRVHAINRRGASEEPVDWMGTTDDLDTLLSSSDAVVLSVPLTARTEGLIGRRELSLMKQDAMLVNLARGEIVDEDALYEHLEANPSFIACIDAWWVEPVRHGVFRMDRPFLDLPNVIASPHNSASVGGWRSVALERAAGNCRRVLDGEAPLNVIGADERSYAAT